MTRASSVSDTLGHTCEVMPSADAPRVTLRLIESMGPSSPTIATAQWPGLGKVHVLPGDDPAV